ncbi:MAG: CHC2 zinc finger domain-containing protein, partial [Faecousia sp.]
MNLFSHVKASVTTRQSAELYGLRVARNGMTCCPFHPDRTPSMKVDARFHCFGCGVDGDVISFVEQLFHLRPFDAAKKLAEDFHIDISACLTKPTDKKKSQAFTPFHPDEQALAEELAEIRQKATQKNLDAWMAHAQDVLIR